MSDRLYDDAMYRFDKPEQSYWEATKGQTSLEVQRLTANKVCDVAVIGAGYTGLSAAYHLCKEHDLDVHVLEAGHIGWGASGRNGGFCSIGGHKLDDSVMLKRYGLDVTRDYYKSQVEAVELVRDLIVEEEIDSHMIGDGEIDVACSDKGFTQLRDHVDFQSNELGLDAELLTKEELSESYCDFPLQHGGSILRPTFGLHPLQFIRGLARAALKHGAEISINSEVIEWVSDSRGHLLHTKEGTVRARNVVVATNGFSPELLHSQLMGVTLPMISAIVVTRPLTNAELQAHQWSTDCPTITAVNLMNYFRLLPDKRFLFGGRGSSDGSVEDAKRNYGKLISRFREVFPEWQGVDIDYQWHGLICMTRRLTPAIGRFTGDPSVFFGFGYHGNGVNTATWSGKQVARWLATGKESSIAKPSWLPDVVYGMPQRFPFAALRLRYIAAQIGMMTIRDKLS